MLYVNLFLFGLIIGSFLNVCIYRIPRGESIVFPSSYCPQCSYFLKPWHLIPVFSFLLLGGRCSHCGEKIPWRYPLVELLTGILFTLLVFRYGFTVETLFYCFFIAALIVIAFIDRENFLIPNIVNLVLLGLGTFFHFFFRPIGWANPFLTFLGTGLFFLFLQLLFRGGLGGGDVKLAAVLGLWLGWPLTVFAIFLGSLLGSIIGISLIILKKRKRKDPLPYGPFLVISTLIILLLGDLIWYFPVEMFP